MAETGPATVTIGSAIDVPAASESRIARGPIRVFGLNQEQTTVIAIALSPMRDSE